MAEGGSSPSADDLDYMHARFFNPVPGRFQSFDPVGGNPRAPQAWNRFAYVLGNPVRNVDPTGMATAGAHLIGDSITVLGQDPCPSAPAGMSCSTWEALRNFIARGRSEHDDASTEAETRGQHRDIASTALTIGQLLVMDMAGQLITEEDRGIGGPNTILGMAAGGPEGSAAASLGRTAARLGKRAADLIRGSLKRSPSYRAELEGLTHREILDLARGGGSEAKGAKQMQKLIAQAERLQEKTGGR